MNKILPVIFLLLLTSSFAFADNELLRKAEAGDAEAQFKIAAMYASGKIGNKSDEDRKKVFEFLEKSASQNYLKSQEILCKQYLDRGNFNKALQWSKAAMGKGSTIGKSVMAYLLYYGENVIPIDKTKAYNLIKECPNEALSKTLLGGFHSEGWFDIEKDLSRAEKYASEAIREKCSKAYILLCSICLKKYSLNHDKKYLYKIEDALEDGLKNNPFNQELKLFKAIYYLKLVPNDDNKKKGLEILENCIKENNKDAYEILAEYELETNHNQSKALEYLLKASDNYCSEASFKVFNLLIRGEDEKGLKLEKDSAKAKEILLKALSFNNQKFIEKYIPLYRMAEKNPEYRKMLGEAYLENFDSNKYIKIAANNGSPSMMFLHSVRLIDNEEETMKYVTGSANMGWADAQAFLAMNCHIDGEYDKAYFWAEKADKQGHCFGTKIMGEFTVNGRASLMTPDEGAKKIREAIFKGCDLNSASALQNYYRFRKGDYYLAYLWGTVYLKGFQQSDDLKDRFQSTLNELESQLSEDEIENAKKEAEEIVKDNQLALQRNKEVNLSLYGDDYYMFNLSKPIQINKK